MQEKNNQSIIKILIGIIIVLSVFILFSGIFYIFNMQNKLTKLEKKQMESQNMASIQSVPDTQQIQKDTTNSVTPQNSNPKISSKKKASTYI